MLLGLEWYWWLMIAAVVIISIPFKVKLMKWWSRQQKEKEDNRKDKWGGEE
ncbi:MAG: hypothetical protein PHR92_11575 [Lachnospiraceae bacterium]|nr:hypothetical protein [Lachnospiraceae bacterium]